MTDLWRPLARGDVSQVVIDGDLVILDADGRLHVFNPSAAAVWRRCDGSSTVTEIAAGLSVRYKEGFVSGDVDVLLRDLRRRRLVT